jgi:hypothetical protein
MDLPPAMWLTFSQAAQRELIAQVGELLHRHLHAQHLGGTHESCCLYSASPSGPHRDGLCAAIDPQTTAAASREYAAAIATGPARRRARLAAAAHRRARC